MSSRQPERAPTAQTTEAGAAAETPAEARTRIGGRYELVAELGRGGMACVYRAIDTTTGRELALKQLTVQADPQRTREGTLLFEREFHTLAQLSHPRVIEVYDFGIDAAGPYYTMELLDGGDLRERSPLPWREACALIFDVCSSLGLLHSRRLVHRDVSPRNVRCTHDGHAKLIDFGAMVPMGSNSQLVGTPPFVPPEVLHGSSLDARTDLFSLGATLYYALTGRLAYPARDFSQLLDTWANKPAPPSASAADVPPALDRLVLSLISLEPALRPRSAFEVMQRLAAVADIQSSEAIDVSRAYLVTPSLVGRDQALAQFHEYMQRAQHGRGRALSIAGAAGSGRSRLLDACALDAKLFGVCVLRANAAAGSGSDFGAAHTLATRLLEALPDAAVAAAHHAKVFEVLFESVVGERGRAVLKPFARPAAERPALQRALLQWFLQVSKQHTLLFAVDDVDRIDEGSVALLATLAERARGHKVVVLASSEQRAGAPVAAGLDVLISRCKPLELRALELAEVELLLGSLFGDVPNLALLSARLYDVAGGSPRQIMELAQHVVDRGAIRYDAGSWSLPEQLTAADLPSSVEEALRARVHKLGALALRLAGAQALARESAFSREDYALLEPSADAKAIDSALDELVAQQIVDSDGHTYMLAHRSAADALCAELTPEERRARHRALAAFHERAGRPVFAAARHQLLANEYQGGLDLLLPLLRVSKDRVEFTVAAHSDVEEISDTLVLALEAARTVGRNARDCHELRKWLTMLSVVGDEALYWQSAPEWRAQLESDSGLCDWRALHEVSDAGPRLISALQAAGQRHAAKPETERVYPPDEAIRLLVHYVATSIAVGARTLDVKLVLSLPELLEPFAPLSPLLAAIWQNAIATCESSCHRQSERARERWLQVYERLAQAISPDPQLVTSIRYAIVFGLGLLDAATGMDAALKWAEILDDDPLQKVSAMYLRKVVRLQQGDLDGAERCRKRAELLALQANSRQMFTNLLTVEIGVHAAAWDLMGVKQIAARIEPLAERHSGWRPYRHLAEGHYQRLRGDLAAACRAYEECLLLATPDPQQPRSIVAWAPAMAAYCETLITLGRAEEAKRHAEQMLAEAERRGMRESSNDVMRALAIAEAKLGDHGGAAARLERLIEQQQAAGVTGLSLGASYEARARVAIWAGDRAAVERYGRLTAEQYRHGMGSPLGARYERLMEEARGAGVAMMPSLSPFETTMFGSTELGTRSSAMATVVSAMQGAEDSAARAQRALKLLCDARGADKGHLFLPHKNELRLVASSTDEQPDETLQRLVSDFWSQQCDDGDPDTALVTEGMSAGMQTQVWRDQRGTHYRPVLISGTLRGTVVNAGVAVLAANDAGAQSATSRLLVSELASYLVRAGDSSVVST